MNIPILICLRHQMGANVWQSELVSHRKSNLRDLWFSFLVHTCKSESHLHVTCRVNWHGCTNFILHCELCICDTTYRLLLVQTGYTQEIYSLYKRCKYVYLKYVWRRWIKITFFHIHTAASYSFMPQTPARCTCLRGFVFFSLSPARIAPHSSSSRRLYAFSFSSLLSISSSRANNKKTLPLSISASTLLFSDLCVM